MQQQGIVDWSFSWSYCSQRSASQSSGTYSCPQPTDWRKVIGCQVTRTPVTEVVKSCLTQRYFKNACEATNSHKDTFIHKTQQDAPPNTQMNQQKNTSTVIVRVHKHAYSTHLNTHWNYTLNWDLWMNRQTKTKTKSRFNLFFLSVSVLSFFCKACYRKNVSQKRKKNISKADS